jgi:hypothetical protein
LRKENDKMKLFVSNEVAETTSCPRCNTNLEREYHSYMVAIDEEGERDAVMMGHDSGLFCPECPTVVLDPKIVEEMISDYVQYQTDKHVESLEYALVGIVDLDAVPEGKKDIPLGDDDNPIPLIELEYVHSKPRGRSEPKVGRNDPCPCGSGKKYKKCCMGKNVS